MPLAPSWHRPTPCPYPRPEKVNPPEVFSISVILQLRSTLLPTERRNLGQESSFLPLEVVNSSV